MSAASWFPVWPSADLLPRPALRGGPNLRAPGRQLNYSAKPVLRIGLTTDVKHIGIAGDSSADTIANRAARIKRDGSRAPGLGIESGAAQGCCNGCRSRGHSGWQERDESRNQLLFLNWVNGAAGVRIGSDEPAARARLHQEVNLLIAANCFESREFQHLRNACGRVVELVSSKRAYELGNSDGRQNQEHGHGNRQFDHAEATNAAAASAGMWGTLTQNRFPRSAAGPAVRPIRTAKRLK